MDNLSLSVIIVTFNSRAVVDACLTSLYADLGARSAQVVVIDNASSDETPTHISDRWPQVTLLRETENRGFAVANNTGIRCAGGDAILLLNPDTVIQPGAIDSLLAALAAHSQAGVIGPMLLNLNGSLQPSCRDFPSLFGDLIGMSELYRLGGVRQALERRMINLSDHGRTCQVDWLSGACLLVRRAALEAVGLMDEGFFMYSEEMEWQYRMALHGWQVWFEPSARVVHLGGASTRAFSGRRIIWQYQSIWRFYHLYRSAVDRAALRSIVWLATWPKVMFLALFIRHNPHRRELLSAFWQVLWLK
jgi:GT2 family glycosyltransferase